jgi:hypothetical protein
LKGKNVNVMAHSSINRILPLLSKVRARGTDQWIAQCPAHEDRSPSLTIAATSDRVLIRCWAGCSANDIVRAIGLELSDLFNDCRCRRPDPKAERRRRAIEILEAWRQAELQRIAEELRDRDIVIAQIDDAVNRGFITEDQAATSLKYELQGYSDLEWKFDQLLRIEDTLKLWRASRSS